jgi:FdhD protein
MARADLLATEEPLGIRVDGSALTMTMRTPGDDVDLAAGFLVGETIVRSHDDIAETRGSPWRPAPGPGGETLTFMLD